MGTNKSNETKQRLSGAHFAQTDLDAALDEDKRQVEDSEQRLDKTVAEDAVVDEAAITSVIGGPVAPAIETDEAPSLASSDDNDVTSVIPGPITEAVDTDGNYAPSDEDDNGVTSVIPGTISEVVDTEGVAEPTAGDDNAVTSTLPNMSSNLEVTSRLPLKNLPTIDIDEAMPEEQAAPVEEHSLDSSGLSVMTDETMPMDAEPYSDGLTPSPAPTPTIEEPKPEKKPRRWPYVLCGVVAAGAITYTGFGIFFMSHFMPNTKVNGEDVSWMGVDELSAHITELGAIYKVQVTGDGMDLTIAAPDIDFVFDGPAYAQEAGDQILAWQWPAEVSKSHEYTANDAISFDEQKLSDIVSNAVNALNETAADPTNATMKYDEEKGKFVSVPDALGTKVQLEPILEKVYQAVRTMQATVTLDDNDLVQPAIREDDERITKGVKLANDIVDSNIVLKIAGIDALSLDRARMVTWITMDPECNLVVDREAVKSWTQGDLSTQFDTAGTKRVFDRVDGKHIEVEGGDPDYNYGWILDGEALANTIADNLQAGNTANIDVPMKRSAATWAPGGKDWPNRYIDVDLSEQHVRMYDDNNAIIWESDCVSGNPIYGGGTDTGVYFIYEKDNPMELVGLDYDNNGEPDYRTWVTYWMPFNGGEGLHDMASRGAFGGDIYTYNGSHGCVNLPYGAAEQLYGITNVGDCVVVHW